MSRMPVYCTKMIPKVPLEIDEGTLSAMDTEQGHDGPPS